MTFALTPITVKDAAAASKPVIAYNDGTNNAFANALLDTTGALVSPATAGNQATANTALAAIAAALAPVQSAVTIAPDTVVSAGRYFVANCAAAGNVEVKIADGSTHTYPLAVGLNVFPLAATEVISAGTTATATYENWV